MGQFRRAYDPDEPHPFRFNNEDDSVDIQLFKDIYEEGVYLYGSDIVYIRTTNDQLEPIFGEHLAKRLESGTPLRAFIEQTEGWEGLGDTFSKYGLRNSDDFTMHMAKVTFEDLGWVPKVGDVIYHVTAKRLWEVEWIKDDLAPTSFMPLGKYIAYSIGCKTYKHDHATASEEILADDNLHIERITNTLFGTDGAGDQTTTPMIQTELDNHNTKIQDDANTFIDASEIDPLG